jgi:hypothetical protein
MASKMASELLDDATPSWRLRGFWFWASARRREAPLVAGNLGLS